MAPGEKWMGRKIIEERDCGLGELSPASTVQGETDRDGWGETNRY